MLVNCTNCNKEIERKKHQLNKNNRYFCNIKCRSVWDKNKFAQIKKEKEENFEKLICNNCNKSYIPKNLRKEQKFCSIECFNETKKISVCVNCDFCNKEIFKKPYHIKTWDKHFCDVNCRSLWNSENKNIQVTKSCLICEKEFKIFNSSKDRIKCCSKECGNLLKKSEAKNNKKIKQKLIENGIKSTLNAKLKETKPEKLTREYLELNKINFFSQHLMYDKFIVDFYLPELNVVIEVLGDYWHANPLFYAENKKPLTEKQKRQVNKDKSRLAYLTKCGHEVHMIWENDIYNDIEKAMKNIKRKK